MKTHFREYRRAKSAAIAAIFFAAVASTSIACGQYTFITSFGTLGSGPGQLNYPLGVAVGPTGQVYVVDSENFRIAVFTATGGTGNPAAIGTGELLYSDGVAVGPTGQIYVADFDLNRIDVFTASGATGNPAAFYGPPFPLEPCGVAVGSTGQVYEADYNGINVFTSTGGAGTPASLGTLGSGIGQFLLPYGVAVGPTGQVYVADPGNNRVDVFTIAGGNGTPASFATTSGSASGVAVGPGTGDVHVVDNGNSSIDVYNSSGQYLTYFGSSGTGNGQFVNPTGVAVSPTGEIYVTDNDYPVNARVVKFFDLAEWVSGAPHFSTAAAGPGQLLGSYLSISTNQGLIVGALTINPGGVLTQSGTVSAVSVTNNGVYTINGTNLTINPGENLFNNATLNITNGGSVVGLVSNYYGATLNTNGATITSNILNEALFNYGSLLQSGQLSISGNFYNVGNATLWGQLNISGSLVNTGLVLTDPGRRRNAAYVRQRRVREQCRRHAPRRRRGERPNHQQRPDRRQRRRGAHVGGLFRRQPRRRRTPHRKRRHDDRLQRRIVDHQPGPHQPPRCRLDPGGRPDRQHGHHPRPGTDRQYGL